jgi:hypothetical protein
MLVDLEIMLMRASTNLAETILVFMIKWKVGKAAQIEARNQK